jgi:hypothetical protein
MDQIAIAPARCAGGNMSAIVPPPIVNGADPAHPAKKRKATSMPIEFETAQAMLKTTKRALATLYSGIRPYSSDMGAMISGPMAKPRIYTDTTKVAMRLDVS